VFRQNESVFGMFQTDNQFHKIGAPQAGPLKEELAGPGKTILS